MMYVKVKKELAEKTRRELVKLGVISDEYEVEKDENFVYFPVKSCPQGFECVEREGKRKERKPHSLREALKDKLTDDELEQLITSFDIIGDIAIIQVPESLEDKAELIAQAIMKVHKNVKTVCQKVGPRQGIFRVAPLKVIAGERKFVTVYKENGVKMKVDVLRTYFSPRLSTERKRIADQVKDGEVIAALFAGVGPFPLVIAKRRKVKIFAVELNPYAYSLMVENIKMNVLKGEIIPIQGDVRVVAKELPKCDRVLMPLPKGGEDFLEEAINLAKPGGIVHFYQFAPEGDLYSDAEKKIRLAAEKLGRKVEIVNRKVVRPHKPRVYQIVIDFRVY